MTRALKWTDEEVLGWAYYFISNPKHSLIELEQDLGVSHSTTWWCFCHRLWNLDVALYGKVMGQLAAHRRTDSSRGIT